MRAGDLLMTTIGRILKLLGPSLAGASQSPLAAFLPRSEAHRTQRVQFASSVDSALLDGLSEQPAGHANGIRDLRHDANSEVVTRLVNTLLAWLGRTKPYGKRAFCVPFERGTSAPPPGYLAKNGFPGKTDIGDLVHDVQYAAQ